MSGLDGIAKPTEPVLDVVTVMPRDAGVGKTNGLGGRDNVGAEYHGRGAGPNGCDMAPGDRVGG
jgi:hypothetical protein